MVWEKIGVVYLKWCPGKEAFIAANLALIGKELFLPSPVIYAMKTKDMCT
jgi:hypothetical protein